MTTVPPASVPISPAAAMPSESVSVPVPSQPVPVVRVVEDTMIDELDPSVNDHLDPEELSHNPVSVDNPPEEESSGESLHFSNLPDSSDSSIIPENVAELSEDRIDSSSTLVPDDATMTTVIASPDNRKRLLNSPENDQPPKLPVIEQSGSAFLSRAGLKDFINSKSSSSKLRQVPLYRVSGSDLRTVAKNFKVPLTFRRDMDRMREFILKKHSGIRKVTSGGETWPIVPLGSGWELVSSQLFPNYYAPVDYDYENLLNLLLKWNIPVTQADVASKESICARLESYCKSGKLRKLELECGKVFYSRS